MLSPLLSTKLLPPRRARGTLPRPRLEQLVERIAEATLTVLKAPPGFGKSTLAGSWAEAALARGGKVAWLNLDEADDSADRLLLYLAAAIQRGFDGSADDNLFKELSLLPVEQLATLLANDLERRSEQCFLFIDDYHCVPPAVLIAAFDSLVRFAPDNLHLVFCGRVDLPAALIAHTYDDACLEVDVGQLRFDLDETRDLLLRTGTPNVDATELLELHAATEGWIAALRASLLTLRQRPAGSARLSNSISGLLDELLARLPGGLAGCLPRLAAVDKFDAVLAEALTGAADGRALIEDIDRRQLFLTTLDAQAQWFSFHPLFREHLHRRLPADALAATLDKAARWFAGQQLWMDAVRSALACGDNDSARAWIAHCAMDMVERGEFVTLVDWQRQLHDRLLESPAQLKLAMGWASGLAMGSGRARQLLAEVRQALPGIADEAQREHLAWECRALEATLLALEDQAEDAGQLASACYPHLRERPWISNTLLNLLCFSHLRTCRWQAFYALPASVRTPLDPNRYQFNQVYRLSLQGLGEALQGRFGQAVALFEEAMRVTAERGITSRSVLRALPASFLGCVRYLQGSLAEAERLIMESVETIMICGFLDCAGVLFITASRLSSSHASPQGARYFLEEGDRLAQARTWPRLQAQLLLERTRVSLLEQKSHEANACLGQLDALRLAHGGESAELSEYACLASLAELWCEAAGMGRQADLEGAERLCRLAHRHNLRLMQLRLAGSLAMVHWRRRAGEQALASLLEVAELLEHCDAPQLLRDLPAQDMLQPLIAHALAQPGLAPALKARLQHLQPSTADSATQHTARLMISLTSKERNVLDLVAQGKSNKEMAKLLGVTPETIKSHMKHIFSKLQVDSRAQAAVAAKACGLI
ncbi:LuxR C-terminal-related transcriptional regulator [Pseudomonas sp. 273]|uniref:LuxR C-terminal-related transcriptional regulator n=1 Tax=Pseudomonas sp. 273 TaxID=75692 RepID=UPI0023D7FF80|nr:LuxR C-terminal-related transcriptional regulator [Pseudomonas sp. 273]